MRISIDKLMKMKPQVIGDNKKLILEFKEVRLELLKKGFNVLTFENNPDKNSRLRFKDRRIVSYDVLDDIAHVIWDDGYEGDFNSGLLNINRLIVIKSIAEYLLKVA